jgi:hypothetical protein
VVLVSASEGAYGEEEGGVDCFDGEAEGRLDEGVGEVRRRVDSEVREIEYAGGEGCHG